MEELYKNAVILYSKTLKIHVLSCKKHPIPTLSQHGILFLRLFPKKKTQLNVPFRQDGVVPFQCPFSLQ